MLTSFKDTTLHKALNLQNIHTEDKGRHKQVQQIEERQKPHNSQEKGYGKLIMRILHRDTDNHTIKGLVRWPRRQQEEGVWQANHQGHH